MTNSGVLAILPETGDINDDADDRDDRPRLAVAIGPRPIRRSSVSLAAGEASTLNTLR